MWWGDEGEGVVEWGHGCGGVVLPFGVAGWMDSRGVVGLLWVLEEA